jgi:flavin-dependent dehydrogenase
LLFEEAICRPWDVVVVGAGPAGALAAHQLAGRGLAVLLIDKASFPRGKVCGSCLNGWALATLDRAGLGTLTTRCGAVPLGWLRLAARERQAHFPLPGGVALSREALDAALVQAAVQAGAHFLPLTHVTLDSALPVGRGLVLRQPDRQRALIAPLVLAADGLGARRPPDVAAIRAPAQSGSRVGAGVIAEAAPAFYHAGTIFMACGTGGYVGLVRLEAGRLDIAAALDPGMVRKAGGPGRVAARVLNEVGWPPVPRMEDLGWRGTPLLTRQALRPAAERVLLLGDAAGYIEPFTGEGIAWALASAAAVAPLAARGWQPSLASRWTAIYRDLIARRQRLCRAASVVLRYPALTRWLVALLGHLPGIARPFVRYLNSPPLAGGRR